MDLDTVRGLDEFYTDTIAKLKSSIIKSGTTAPHTATSIVFIGSNNRRETVNRCKRTYKINREIDIAFSRFMELNPIYGVNVKRVYQMIVSKGTKVEGVDLPVVCAIIGERLYSPLDAPYFKSGKPNGDVQIKISDNATDTVVTDEFGNTSYVFGIESILDLLDNTEIDFNPDRLTLADIVYRVGVLEAVAIYGAGYIPRGMYILDIVSSYITGSIDNNRQYKRGAGIRVSMANFSSAVKIADVYSSDGDIDTIEKLAVYISDVQRDYSAFHPHRSSDSELRKAYLDGYALGYDAFETTENRKLYDQSILLYTQITP